MFWSSEKRLEKATVQLSSGSVKARGTSSKKPKLNASDKVKSPPPGRVSRASFRAPAVRGANSGTEPVTPDTICS